MYPVVGPSSEEDFYGSNIDISKSQYQFHVLEPTLIIKMYGEMWNLDDAEAEKVVRSTPFPDSQ